MKRRDFVILTATGATAIALPSAYYYFGDAAYDVSLATPESLSLIWDSQTIKAIGAAYLRQVPDEASVRDLVGQLPTDSNASLEEVIKNDFATGNHVLVDGWILSVTEARQCALASIAQPKS